MIENSNASDIAARRLWTVFEEICDCGGRQAGTDGEAKARGLLKRLGKEMTGAGCHSIPVPYLGWRAEQTRLYGPDGNSLLCRPLIRSVPTGPSGVEAEVLDLGRGTPEAFDAHGGEISGRIVMVRHELMFSEGTIHRSLKYKASVDRGAVGFLIVGPLAGSSVAGSTGRRGTEPGIPALGIGQDIASLLMRRTGSRPRVRMVVEATEEPLESENLVFEMPGLTSEWIVLSAHLDGHDIGESAIDNASGVAVAMAVAHSLSPRVADCRRGLRLVFFSVEEWALTGSAQYVDGLSESERQAIALNVNIDSVGVGSPLTALTSGFAGIEPFLLEQAGRTGLEIGLYRPLQINSDHANFARAGIPAFRLVSGFNDSTAATRFVLTAEDTRDRVSVEALSAASRLAGQIVASALDATADQAAAWRQGAEVIRQQASWAMLE